LATALPITKTWPGKTTRSFESRYTLLGLVTMPVAYLPRAHACAHLSKYLNASIIAYIMLAGHIRNERERLPRFIWDDCGYNAATAGDLKKHTRTHTGEKPFACHWEGCSYSTSQAGHLKRHTRTHTGKKLFACHWEGCGYSASDDSNLKDHTRTHTGEKPFACQWEDCGYSTSQATNLKRHTRTHTGEKPFACQWEECGYSASRASSLKAHRRTHTGDPHGREAVCLRSRSLLESQM